MQEQGHTSTKAMQHIDEILPLSDKDESCLREVREVLRKHGALQRLGVALLHDHFTLASDEVLVEVCNQAKRELTIMPVKQSEMNTANMIETIWRLDGESGIAQCVQRCECATKVI